MNEYNEFLVEEIKQVEYLQTAVMEMTWGASQSTDTKYLVEYYHHYYALVEKQQILWTRLKLMANPDLIGLEIAIQEVCDALGKPPSQGVEEFHMILKEEIKFSLSELTGEDLEDFDGIEVDFRWD